LKLNNDLRQRNEIDPQATPVGSTSNEAGNKYPIETWRNFQE
jgi:hypothetical protein